MGLYSYQCRACLSVVTDKPGRRKHHDDKGCTLKLLKAYEELLHEGLCTICAKPTRGKKFGIPVCGEECEARLCNDVPQPELLKKALEKGNDELQG